MTSDRRHHRRPGRRRFQEGFTLLEMLVVMLIAGMALLLTTQALGQYQRAHTRAIANERTGREQRNSEAWFRESVRGLEALAPKPGEDAAPAFEGDARGFSGTTLSPVLQRQGIPTAQRWRIVATPSGADQVELEEGDGKVVLSLPMAGSLRLHYVDAKGALHDRWPPALGAWPQLPDAIVLEFAPVPGAAHGTLIAASVLGPRDPIDVPYEHEQL
jgi:general secretion pathway protein J